jgi:hypothetical protein
MVSLTATPIINGCREVGGQLSQIWNPLWELRNMGYGFIECYRDDFNPESFSVTEDEKTTVSSLVPEDNEKDHDAYLAYQTALHTNTKVC